MDLEVIKYNRLLRTGFSLEAVFIVWLCSRRTLKEAELRKGLFALETARDRLSM
jgi:hypothetical protein